MIRAIRIALWLPIGALVVLLAVSFDRESRDREAERVIADSIGAHQARAASAIAQALTAERRADSIARLRSADSIAIAEARRADDRFRRRLRRVSTPGATTAATQRRDPAARGDSAVTIVLVHDGAGQLADTLTVPAPIDSALRAAWARADLVEADNARLVAELSATRLARDGWRESAGSRAREAALERERRTIAERAASGAARRGVAKGAIGAVAVIGTLALVLGGR